MKICNRIYRKGRSFSLLLFLFIIPSYGFSYHEDSNSPFQWFKDLYYNVQCDYSVYYSLDNLQILGGVFLASGVIANTNIDQSIRKFWQRNIRSKTVDQAFRFPVQVGRFNYFKVYIGSSILGYLRRETTVGNIIYTFGDRALRGMFLISPQEVFISWALGNGKPMDKADSRWHFFGKGGNAGCSGHAFNGAVPFFTAALMTNSFYRYGLYALGVLPGLSRINNDSHYFSQVLIGWALAYLSTKAVEKSDEIQYCTTRINICPLRKGAMINATVEF